MNVSQCLTRVAVLLMMALLAACSTTTQPGGQPAPPVAKPQAPVIVAPPPATEHQTPPRPATHSASAAWQPLLAKAELASERGDYEQALALLERAQRIDPDSAEVYLGIARTQLAKGDVGQARAMAERGLLYCSSDSVCSALRAFTR
ncbi:MAG: tetratricopeptide repeat protein [Halioglobus sp.]|nr:tetratricopeptide repeat protein [Halioglobus sp.]